MGTYVLRRLVATVPVLLLVSVVVFSLIHLIPGDPVEILMGESRDPAVLARWRSELGLDQPLHAQYARWLGQALRGDLGRSIRTNQPVAEMILARLGPTLQISGLALMVALAVALPAGILSATRRNSLTDVLASFIALAGLSMPNFVVGLILIYTFAVWLGWLPTSGYVDVREDPVAGLKSLVLPSLTLGVALAAIIARMTRSSLLEALSQDYIRTARAKGLRGRAVVMRHALRNALVPVVTVVALQAGGLIAGAVITEYLFAIPGVGRLVVDAIFSRDFPVVQGVVLASAVGFIACNLAADLIYAVLDPRIRDA